MRRVSIDESGAAASAAAAAHTVPRRRFEGKAALVTGASSGIGYATALRLAKEGAKVLLVSRSPMKLESAVHAVRRDAGVRGAAVGAHCADVRDPAACAEMIAAAVERFGELHCVFLNTGAAPLAPLLEMDESTFDLIMATNVKGVMFGLQATLRAMVAGGHEGSVVVNSSVVGMHPSRAACDAGVYAASQAAVNTLVQTAAKEGVESGVRCNAVCLGAVRAGIFAIGRGVAGEAESAALAPATNTRLAEVDEVANVVLFLLSSESSYVTGSLVTVDGGRLVLS